MNSTIARRGILLVLSSPSGAGKTTIAKKVLENDTNISISISATTRPKRPHEVANVDYYFLSPEEFDVWEKDGLFIEHARVFDNRYGTPKKPVLDALSKGQDLLFDIDWQGTLQLSKLMPDDIVKIFILPPSRTELVNRLNLRAQDDAKVIDNRMLKANDELSHWEGYDYIIINEALEVSVANILSILKAERLRRDRLLNMTQFVQSLSM
jgi:guanylate kinase